MGCGVSRPETEEGGEDQGSIGNSEIIDSYTYDQEISRHSKISKTDVEKICKEDKDECKDEEEKGDENKISPASPSFRIYCVFPRDRNDDNVIDDPPGNKYISNDNKKGKRQEAVGIRIKRGFNNVKKLLTPPTTSSSSAT